MQDQKDEKLTPYILADRNEILLKYANFSFREALSEVNNEIETEKERSRRLGLLAAKSWILRKKLYASLHDPYISALSEVEDTDIFDGLDDEDFNEYDSLFEDSERTQNRDPIAKRDRGRWQKNSQRHNFGTITERSRGAYRKRKCKTQ